MCITINWVIEPSFKPNNTNFCCNIIVLVDVYLFGNEDLLILTSYSKIYLVLTLPQKALSSSQIYSSCLPSNDTPPLLI
jgi:flagellar biosynthesis protein FliP